MRVISVFLTLYHLGGVEDSNSLPGRLNWMWDELDFRICWEFGRPGSFGSEKSNFAAAPVVWQSLLVWRAWHRILLFHTIRGVNQESLLVGAN